MSDFELTERLDSDAAVEYLENLIKRNRKVYNIEVVFGPGTPSPEMWIYDDPVGSESDAIRKDCLKLVSDATRTFGKLNVLFEITHN